MHKVSLENLGNGFSTQFSKLVERVNLILVRQKEDIQLSQELSDGNFSALEFMITMEQFFYLF